MGAPKGDGGAGLIDSLKDLIERLRLDLTHKIDTDVGEIKSEVEKNAKEMGDKFKDLTERLAKCEIDTKMTDDR